VAGGVLVDPDVAGALESEVADGDAVPVEERGGEADGTGEAPGDMVGVGTVIVVVVPAALACRISKVDQEPMICTIAAISHIAVHIAQTATARPSTFLLLPFDIAPTSGMIVSVMHLRRLDYAL
jgi:hypothetical protein